MEGQLCKVRKMVLLEKLWDDVVAGPQPDRGLGKLRKITTKPLIVKGKSLILFFYYKLNSG